MSLAKLPYGITQCYLSPDTSKHTWPSRFTPAYRVWLRRLKQCYFTTFDTDPSHNGM